MRQRCHNRAGLHQSLGRSAGLRDRDESCRREREPRQHLTEGFRIEIVEKMQTWSVTQQTKTGNRVATKLRQGLATEARPSGSKEHDVGRLGAKPLRDLCQGGKIVRAVPATAAAAVRHPRAARATNRARPGCAPAQLRTGLCPRSACDSACSIDCTRTMRHSTFCTGIFRQVPAALAN